MSHIKLNEFRNQAAEEEFLRLAALEIDAEQNEAFVEAQSLPDPPPEVLQRIQQNLQATMRQTQKKKRHHTIFLYLGRFTACAAVVCGVMFSGVYLGVDAARSSINNFVLEIFDGNAMIFTKDSEVQTGIPLPKNWDGPFYVTWVPSRFSSVQSISLDSSWILLYNDEANSNNISISVWDTSIAPNIDIENTTFFEQVEIQNSTASIYFKPVKDVYTLLWGKSNYIIMITGDISSEEIKKIAKNIQF